MEAKRNGSPTIRNQTGGSDQMSVKGSENRFWVIHRRGVSQVGGDGSPLW